MPVLFSGTTGPEAARDERERQETMRRIDVQFYDWCHPVPGLRFSNDIAATDDDLYGVYVMKFYFTLATLFLPH